MFMNLILRGEEENVGIFWGNSWGKSLMGLGYSRGEF